MKLLDFYRDCVQLVRHDLVKQKMLLPPDTIAGLCSQHHRQHRSLAEKLSTGDAPRRIFAIQKAYPRTGTVRTDFDALALAKSYEAQKADAVAVVTEKHYYCGEPSMLTGVAHMVNLPIIRWDFIVDSYQLMQSKLWGADVVRIIVPLLDQVELAELYTNALSLGLEIIWEIHSAADAERIVDFKQSSIVYIENEALEFEQVENILKKLPSSPPPLLNGDSIDPYNVNNSVTAGMIYFALQEA